MKAQSGGETTESTSVAGEAGLWMENSGGGGQRSGRELGRQSMGEAAQCLLPTHSTPPNAEGTGQLIVTANITDLSHAGYFP